MKRSIIAVTVAGILPYSLVDAAEIYNQDGNKLNMYGRVNAKRLISSNGASDGDISYFRFGLQGQTTINSELTGYGQFEYQMQANQTDSDKSQMNHTRLGFAGLKYANWGSLDYGRNYGVLYDVASWTDRLPEFSDLIFSAPDSFMGGRGNGMLTWRNSNFFGLVDDLKFTLQYQGKNEGKSGERKEDEGRGTSNRNSRNARVDNGDGFGMSLSYNIGWDISAIGAFSNSSRTTQQQSYLGKNQQGTVLSKTYGDKAESYATGLQYDDNKLYLAALYGQNYNTMRYGSAGLANKTVGFEAIVQYQFDFGLRPSLSWRHSQGKDLGANENIDKKLFNYMNLAAVYYFNKDMSTFVDYKINLLDGNDPFYKSNGINTDNVVALGIVYQF
ncbi:MAG: porin [Enterobacteriaceae bacterium]